MVEHRRSKNQGQNNHGQNNHGQKGHGQKGQVVQLQRAVAGNNDSRFAKMSASSTARRFSFRKKALYGCLATSLFFMGLEMALALVGVQPVVAERDPFVGFVASIPLFVERQGDAAILETANNRLAYFNSQNFSKSKSADSYRIFCVGGSTTYGRPYDDSTSFSAWLREILDLTDDARKWEVINAGGISYASYRVAAVVDELCRYEPDLFIVYMGHNEFLEERTYRDFHRRTDLLRPVAALLHSTRVYALAHRMVAVGEPDPQSQALLPAEVDTLLDHAVGPDAYHRDDAWRLQTLQHYEFNLRRIVDAATAVGAEVLLITPSANSKDFSPFKSEFLAKLDERRQAEWFDLFLQASKLEAQGKFDAALDKLRSAAAIDSGRADLHFQMGRLLFKQGEFPVARECFLQAVELDVCPLRVILPIQTIIERVAISQGVPLIDFNSILQNDSLRARGHAALGNEYFVDHVHPTIESHRLLALAITEALIQKGVVRPNSLWREQAVAQVSRKIESRLDPALQAKALTNLAQVLTWAGKEAEAGPLAARAVSLRSEHNLPEEPESLFYLAVHLETLGANEQATTLYEKVLQHVPDSLQTRKRLGTLLYDQQRYDEAQVHFKELARQAPRDAATHHWLGIVLLELKQTDEALKALMRAQRLEPDSAAIAEDLRLARLAERRASEPE